MSTKELLSLIPAIILAAGIGYFQSVSAIITLILLVLLLLYVIGGAFFLYWRSKTSNIN